MKRAIYILIGLGLVACSYAAEPPQQPPPKKDVKLHLVKITNRAGEEEYKLISSEELKSLQNELVLEAKCFEKAMNLTEKEWKKDEDTAKKPFPASAINKRKVEELGFFTDEKKAEEKLARYQKSSDEKKKEKEDKKRPGNDERSKKLAEREAERLQLEEKARQLFESKLAELMKPLQQQKEGDAAKPKGFGP
jgi:hypothetical protein